MFICNLVWFCLKPLNLDVFEHEDVNSCDLSYKN